MTAPPDPPIRTPRAARPGTDAHRLRTRQPAPNPPRPHLPDTGLPDRRGGPRSHPAASPSGHRTSRRRGRAPARADRRLRSAPPLRPTNATTRGTPSSGGADVRWSRRQVEQTSVVTTLPKPARPPASQVERTPGVSSATGHRARPADPRPHARQRPSPAHSRTVSTGRFPVARPQPTATATRPGENPGAPTIPIHATAETGDTFDRPPPLQPLPGPCPQPGAGVAVDLEPDRGTRYRRWAARRPRVERALVRVDPDGDQVCFRSPVMGSPAAGNLTSGRRTSLQHRV
jgi:hypothetical protein